MDRKLKLATWNANGLAKHSLEVKAFILSHDIDILLVSETHFTNKNYFQNPGYTLYHTMHSDGKTHGGTAIIIRIKHYEIDKHQRDFLQATSVMMETWNGCITISAVYSPQHVIKSKQYIKFLETLGNRFIAAGDYNAKHTQSGLRLTSPRGPELLKAIDIMKLSIVLTGELITGQLIAKRSLTCWTLVSLGAYSKILVVLSLVLI